MKIRNAAPLIGLFLLLPIFLTCMSAAQVGSLEPSINQSTLLEVLSSLERGGQYLVDHQLDDGSWANHPVITSFATMALANSPTSGAKARGNYAIQRALDYLSDQAKDDGAIWNKLSRQYPLYSTAISMFALVRMGRAQDQEVLRAARNYLIQSQIVDPDSISRGGFARGESNTPTLTTTQWVLEALYLTDHLDGEPDTPTGNEEREQALAVYRRAQSFIERCQQLRSLRTDKGVLVQGGYFSDFPQPDSEAAEKQAERFPGTPRSRAFLTCAGLKSLIYARIDRSDTRVIVAADWLKGHYAVSENPGFEQAGFYTYLLSLTQALRALQWDVLRTPGGETRLWRLDVALELLSRQRGDGSWRQGNAAWWENRPELVTAYGMMMLEISAASEITAWAQPAETAEQPLQSNR